MIPRATWIDTTLVTPSLLGCSSVMRPRGQDRGEELSSLINTSVPGLIVLILEAFLFGRYCNCDRYSWCHRSQKCYVICSRCWYLFNLCMLILRRSACGCAVSASPVRKCPEVRGVRSFGSLDRGDKDLEFKHATIWVYTA